MPRTCQSVCAPTPSRRHRHRRSVRNRCRGRSDRGRRSADRSSRRRRSRSHRGGRPGHLAAGRSMIIAVSPRVGPLPSMPAPRQMLERCGLSRILGMKLGSPLCSFGRKIPAIQIPDAASRMGTHRTATDTRRRSARVPKTRTGSRYPSLSSYQALHRAMPGA